MNMSQKLDLRWISTSLGSFFQGHSELLWFFLFFFFFGGGGWYFQKSESTSKTFSIYCYFYLQSMILSVTNSLSNHYMFKGWASSIFSQHAFINIQVFLNDSRSDFYSMWWNYRNRLWIRKFIRLRNGMKQKLDLANQNSKTPAKLLSEVKHWF